jgi:hypothetical protein
MERKELENVSEFTLGDKNAAFAHLSLIVPTEGSSNKWWEAVTDEQYCKLKKA